jgi:plastocyanin
MATDPKRPRRRPPIALTVVAVSIVCLIATIVIVGSPKRPLAGSARTAARPRALPPAPASPVTPVAPAPSSPAAPASPPSAPPPPPPAPAASGAYRVVAVANGGSITGTCRLSKEVPTWDVERTKDVEKCSGEKLQPTERLVTGPDRALGNCVVFLRAIAAGKDFPEALRAEGRTHFVDQKGCKYVPHVSWARVATQLTIGNADIAEHNIHGYKDSRSVTQFNFSTKPQSRVDDQEAAFLEKPGLYILKCDIHPWMSGYVHVAPHPYYDVTSARDDAGKKAGTYALTDVPPGDYEVVCWHEGMKEEAVLQQGKIIDYIYGHDYVSPPRKVTVEAGKAAVVDFEVPAP